MKGIIPLIILINLAPCSGREDLTCNSKFFECAAVCGDICERTIKYAHEFGKCFAACNSPCRKEFCRKVK